MQLYGEVVAEDIAPHPVLNVLCLGVLLSKVLKLRVELVHFVLAHV